MSGPPQSERLYALLPAIYRLRDAEQGEPLRALLAVLESQARDLELDIAALHQSWFIETCPEWLIPYIGDLLGVRGLLPVGRAASQRAYVANTLGYRRRKGTVAVLEQLAQDVTGWPAMAVEFFQRLVTTQHLNHLRPSNLHTVDLRNMHALERLGGPFETSAHTAEVRRIASVRGRYNIPNVGLFVWRLQALPMTRVPAAPDPALGAGRFRFSPLGQDLHLFQPYRTDRGIEDRTQESDVPGPLSRRALYDELEAARQALSDGQERHFRAFGPQPVLRITPQGELPVLPEAIQICNLSDWATLPSPKTITSGADTVLSDGQTQLAKGDPLTSRVVVDPVLGRLAFTSGAIPTEVQVDFFRGFSTAMGGGNYDRGEELPAADERPVYPVSAADSTSAFQSAVAAWEADGRPAAVFKFQDSGSYAAANLQVPAGVRVDLYAAALEAPHLVVSGTWEVSLQADAVLSLHGLLVRGGTLQVTTTGTGPLEVEHRLELHHCTLVPGLALTSEGAPATPDATSLALAVASTGELLVKMRQSITGRLALRPTGSTANASLTVEDSILDSAGGTKPALETGSARLARVTVLGATQVATLHATDTFFTGTITAERTQEGCCRYSFVPPGSVAPRCYRCQPQLTLREAPVAEHPRILASLEPAFASVRYGEAGYAQLARTCPERLRAGGTEESEMGAFHALRQPHREANLRVSLEEYLRFGLEAGIHFIT